MNEAPKVITWQGEKIYLAWVNYLPELDCLRYKYVDSCGNVKMMQFEWRKIGVNGEIVSNLDWERIATENTEAPKPDDKPMPIIRERLSKKIYSALWWRDNKSRYQIVRNENGKRVRRVIESERRK